MDPWVIEYIQPLLLGELGDMNPAIRGISTKKSLHGIKNNQLKRSGFHELVRKSETVEPVAYFHRLKQYPYLEQLIKSRAE